MGKAKKRGYRAELWVICVLLSLILLSGCVAYDVWDACETIRKGDEVVFTYPPAKSPLAREIEVKSTHLPTACRSFYNDGTGRWAECMGVGPK